jgi:hypothetical protein
VFFRIFRWVSIENYNPIFLQELALVFQAEHRCRVIAHVPNPFFATDGPSARHSTMNK